MAGVRRPTEPAIKVARVMPLLPDTEDGRLRLLSHLTKMGCPLFLDVPWAWPEPQTVTEILCKDNRWHGTIRGDPDQWTVQHWRETYRLEPGAITTVESRDEFLHGVLSKKPDAKEGWTLDDVNGEDYRMVIGFMNPIFHPDKPKRVTAKWASTFVGSMRGELHVDWAVLMKAGIDREVLKLRKVKRPDTCCLPTFLIHLYWAHDLLTKEELESFNRRADLQRYAGDGTESEGEEEPRSPSPTRRTQTPGTERGGPSSTPRPTPTTPGRQWAEMERERPSGPPVYTGRPFEDLAQATIYIDQYLEYLRKNTVENNLIVREVVKITGSNRTDECIAKLRSLADLETRSARLEAELVMIQGTLNKANQELAGLRVNFEDARNRADASVRQLYQVREALTLPVDVANQCAVYQQFLTRQPDPTRKALVHFMHDRAQSMEKTWLVMRQLVEGLGAQHEQTLGRGTAGPSSPSRPAQQTTPHQRTAAPSPATRTPAPPVQRVLDESTPLPEPLDDLHTVPLPEGVEGFNPDVINLDESPVDEPVHLQSFNPVQGTPSPTRAVHNPVPVSTRSPSPALTRTRKAAETGATTPGSPSGPALKKAKKASNRKEAPHRRSRE